MQSLISRLSDVLVPTTTIDHELPRFAGGQAVFLGVAEWSMVFLQPVLLATDLTSSSIPTPFGSRSALAVGNERRSFKSGSDGARQASLPRKPSRQLFEASKSPAPTGAPQGLISVGRALCRATCLEGLPTAGSQLQLAGQLSTGQASPLVCSRLPGWDRAVLGPC
jgi:hypothetical protein